MKTIQIDQAGRVVLPKPVREMLKLVPGDSLKVTVESSGIRLEPEQDSSGLTRKGSLLVISGTFTGPVSNNAVNRLLDQDRDERMASILETSDRR
jgi:AbrB family looped-hinge helix DNA binding protein